MNVAQIRREVGSRPGFLQRIIACVIDGIVLLLVQAGVELLYALFRAVSRLAQPA
jgi:hypothetical protein